MPDLLVKLYELPMSLAAVAEAEARGVTIRKPTGAEKHLVEDWVLEHFSDNWSSEVDITTSRLPFTSFIAIEQGELAGFACYDATGLGLFGPIGVREQSRGRGIGGALLTACLVEMKLKGYAYAVICQAGPVEFYQKCCSAVVVPDSEPGLLADMLRRPKPAT